MNPICSAKENSLQKKYLKKGKIHYKYIPPLGMNPICSDKDKVSDPRDRIARELIEIQRDGNYRT